MTAARRGNGTIAAARTLTFLICINRRFDSGKPSCAARGSLALAEAIETGVRERRIDIDVERIVCLGQCQHGPSMRFAPGGDFLLGVSMDQVADILDRLEDQCGVRQDRDDGPPLNLLGS